MSIRNASRCRRWNLNATAFAFTASVLGVAVAGSTLSGCDGGLGDRLDVGSDLLWTARHELGDLSEWAAPPGGGAQALAPSAVEISSTQVHQGRFGAKLTITAANMLQNAALGRAGGLPQEAYYSVWYYLPQQVGVGAFSFWVIMKFRIRGVADNPGTAEEMYDLNLYNLSGGMALRLYDHRLGDYVTMDVADPIVPTERWFHVEAFYRNAQDATGRFTLWLNGTQLVDIQRMAMAPNSWVEWQACSVGANLVPPTAVLYVDDAAISRTRVTPTGIIAR